MKIRDCKFRIYGPEHSKAVQEALFARGYKWGMNGDAVSHTDGRWIYAHDDGVLTYVGYDFPNDGTNAATLDDLYSGKLDVPDEPKPVDPPPTDAELGPFWKLTGEYRTPIDGEPYWRGGVKIGDAVAHTIGPRWILRSVEAEPADTNPIKPTQEWCDAHPRDGVVYDAASAHLEGDGYEFKDGERWIAMYGGGLGHVGLPSAWGERYCKSRRWVLSPLKPKLRPLTREEWRKVEWVRVKGSNCDERILSVTDEHVYVRGATLGADDRAFLFADAMTALTHPDGRPMGVEEGK